MEQYKNYKNCQAVMIHVFNFNTVKQRQADRWISMISKPGGQPGLQELVPGQTPKLQRNPISKTKYINFPSFQHE